MNIHLVSSSPTTRVTLRSYLSEHWNIKEFESGDEFLSMLRLETESFIVLLGLDLPGISGFDVMRYLKNCEDTKDTPVIIITEHSDKETEYRCLQLGAADFISAPLNPDVTCQRVENVISQYAAFNAMVMEIKRTTNFISDNVSQDGRKVTYQVLTSLSSTIDAKDYYTKGHSARVAEYSLFIGRELGLPQEELEKLYFSALLHDIGKIGVSDLILRKNGKLSNWEYGIIKKHPITGYNILKTITLMPEIAQSARWHHERYDGEGYPDAIKGTKIPLYSRIIAVADSFDAMTSDRAYRQAMSIEDARQEIADNKGYQFDPDIASIMQRLIATEAINKAVGKGEPAIFFGRNII